MLCRVDVHIRSSVYKLDITLVFTDTLKHRESKVTFLKVFQPRNGDPES